MTYDVTLVQVNAPIEGFARANTTFGFPLLVPFDTLLFSIWTCLPQQTVFPFTESNGGPQYTYFFGLNAGGGLSQLTLGRMSNSTALYSANFAGAPANVRTNHLISVNCLTQTVQYYINDVPSPVTSGGWLTTGSFEVPASNIWGFDVGSGFGMSFPAFADLWFGKTDTFIDLSIEGNRRKFINPDLTPVFLGNDGSQPFGVAPQIYQTILPAGVPDDFLINRGSGGGSFSLQLFNFLTFQTPGTCTLAPPPFVNVNLTGVETTVEISTPSTIIAGTLVMTDIEVIGIKQTTIDDQVTLRWSDDAGASWSNGLLRSLGKTGEYYTTPTWYRLGMSRNRILELSWSGAHAEALQGAFVEVTIAAT